MKLMTSKRVVVQTGTLGLLLLSLTGCMDNLNLKMPSFGLGSGSESAETVNAEQPKAEHKPFKSKTDDGTERDMVIYLSNHPKPCQGVAAGLCMEVKYDAKEDWSLFYGSIDGFIYQAGYYYTLKVHRGLRENPAADQSRYVWKLLEVVNKTPATKRADGTSLE
ncbi:DUF4377 domain-containing protein [Pokkaliibacter plantistimulans]|nr:DUF4377 domain-containing protein [Pokkaliibacter plantistimulans]